MYSVGSGDARSVASASARDSTSSMPPDHSSPFSWDRPSFSRDKFDRPDRDRFVSSKKDSWPLDNRSSSYRSSGALFSNGGLSGPPSKRRALGRHGSVDNGRYGPSLGRPSEMPSSLRSPSENISKAERDSFGLSGSLPPGFSSSPVTDKPNKDTDSLHYRETHLSPGDSRSPRYEISPRFGNHSGSGSFSTRDSEKLKSSNSSHHGWDVLHRDRDARERTWGRPDFYRRPCPLPKLDSRDIPEGRIDRYGSAFNRESSFSDALGVSSKEHSRLEWRGRDRSLYAGLSSRTPGCTSNTYLRDISMASYKDEGCDEASPRECGLFSEDPNVDDSMGFSKKRPRLTWGQGLAKYEKEKTEDSSVVKKSDTECQGLVKYEKEKYGDSSYVKKSDTESSYEQSVQPHSIANSDNAGYSLQNGNTITSPRYNSPPVEYEPSISGSHGLAADRQTDTAMNIDSCPLGSNDDSQKAEDTSEESRLGSRISNLQCVQDFLVNFNGALKGLSKDILTQYVEKVEFEIDLIEKELSKMNTRQRLVSQSHEEADVRQPNGLYPEESILPEIEEMNIQDERHCKQWMNVLQHSDDPVLDCMGDSLQKNVDALLIHDQEVLSNVISPTDDDRKDLVDDVMPDAMVIDSVNTPLNTEVGPDVAVVVKSSQIEDVEAGKDTKLVNTIISCNQRIARNASAALSHLYPQTLEPGRLYSSPEDAMVWKLNAFNHKNKKKYLEAKIAERLGNSKFEEGVLAIKFRAQRELWKNERKLNLDSDFGHSDQFLQRSSVSVAGTFSGNESSNRVKVAEKLLKKLPIPNERKHLRMPAMLLGCEKDHHRFESKNALVEDPVAAEQERKRVNPWSEEEKKIFLDKYLLLGKNLRGIADFLEHKTVADCVQFYYLNQKSEEFEKVRRRHLLKKRRESRSSALYLATTTSISTLQREADAICVEGLSLVAAAAAAMSMPSECTRTIRTPAKIKNSGPKVFHERQINKQASDGLAITGKQSSTDHVTYKNSRNTSNRLLKTPTEESSSQWTDNERELFLSAVQMFGRDFHSISSYIGTKNERQCKTFFSKARKRLGLDQLVEYHRANIEKTNEKLGQVVNANEKQECEMCAEEPDRNYDIDDISVISALKSLQGSCAADCLSAEVGNMELNVDHVKSEIKSSVDGESCIPSNVASNLAEISNCKSLPLNVKAEPTILSNVNTSCIHDSVVAANSSVATHMTHNVTSKEKGVKGTEPKTRREPTSWTPEEKEKFLDIIKTHGKNWELLCESLPSKSLTQIKTYFQNSKAKLALGLEGTTSRSSTSSKKKVDVSESSTNTSGGQKAPQMLPQVSEEANIKGSSVLPILNPTDIGVNGFPTEAIAYAHLFGRTLIEDPTNAKKLFQNVPPPGIFPILNPGIFSQPSLHPTQQPYIHAAQQSLDAQTSIMATQPIPSAQCHQLQTSGIPHPDLLPAAQHISNQSSIQQLPPASQLQQQQQITVPDLQQQTTDFGIQQPLQTLPAQWQQQLHLAVQQGHNLHNVVNQSGQSGHSVTPQAASSPLGLPIANVSQSIPTHQQQQLQSQLFHMHAKSVQQAVQLHQLQLLQRHWQQQQSQLQQAQAQAIAQSRESQSPVQILPQTFPVQNEQYQQQLAAHKGFVQACNSSTPEQLKEATHNGSQEIVPFETCKSQAIQESQNRGGDVKLFGQSLLVQPIPCNVQQNSKGVPSSLNAYSSLSSDKSIPQSMPAVQVPVNLSVPEHSFSTLASPSGTQSSIPDSGPESYPASFVGGDLKRDLSGVCESHVTEVPTNSSQVDTGNSLPSVPASLDNGSVCDQKNVSSGKTIDVKSDNRWADQFGNNGVQIKNQEGASPAGCILAPSGLPRVLEALKALAEWRLQNSNGGTGKLTDEFLSQSWETLQKDPGSLLEISKSGGPFASVLSGGPEVLQHLKESFQAQSSQCPRGSLQQPCVIQEISQSSGFQYSNGIENPHIPNEIEKTGSRDLDGNIDGAG